MVTFEYFNIIRSLYYKILLDIRIIRSKCTYYVFLNDHLCNRF